MKLERFREKDKKKIGIIIFTVCCIFLIAGVFLYKTFALFEEKSNLNMIEGQVQDVGDLYFSFYVNGVISKAMPTKDSGYVLDNVKTNCSNGASATLDEEDWSIKIFNMTTTRTKCNVFFKTPGTESILNGADPVITGSLIPINLANDGTVTKADTTQEWYNYALGCPTCDNDTSGVTSITNGQPWPESKYYDTYAYSTGDQQYNRRILGDATGEMGPFGTATYTSSNGTSQTRTIGSWYVDDAFFVTSASPWFMRGGVSHNNGLYTGMFAFNNWFGHMISSLSFRVVLTP